MMNKEDQLKALATADEPLSDVLAPDGMPDAAGRKYQVIGPTKLTNRLLITRDGNAIATVPLDVNKHQECRMLAWRLSRALPRTELLQHVLAELMKADEGAWSLQIQSIRAELRITGDV